MHGKRVAWPALLSSRALPNPPIDLTDQVAAALREDVGGGDLTAALIPAGRNATATVIAREEAILCGSPWFDETFRQVDPAVRVDWMVREGEPVMSNATLCRLEGPARALLTGERTALNFLQTLSATATAARHFVDAIAGTGCQILDTRKTLPGLRTAQKYATACGGARNHRMGLYDAVLIKENHIAAAGSITAAIAQARADARLQARANARPQARENARNHATSPILVEVEVETLDELREAIAARPNMILLDDFPLEDLRTAVQLNRADGSRIKLEASGGVTLANVRSIAETGVDFISIGAITKHVRALDLSMRIK